MKKKSIKLMILTTIVTASFSTNIVCAAKPDFNEKNTNKLEQKQENYNKKISKETYTLSKRLNQIEDSYKKVNVKLEEYFNESNDSQSTTDSTATTNVPTETTTDSTATTDVPTETTTDSAATTDVLTETTTDSAATTDVPTETTTDSTATTDVPTDTTTDSTATTDVPTGTTTDSAATTDVPTETTTDSTATTDVPTETTTDSTATTDVPTGTTTDNTSTTDTDTEMENEYENEDNQINNSFYGKLNAIMNRLNTVKRQLNRFSSSDSEDISKLNTRTDELINQVKASMDKVSNLQSENVKSLKSKSDKKIMEDQNISEQKKSWKIHFTKAVDPETINSKNIMVVDSKNNIVDVDVSYNQDSNDIIIEAKDGFIKSEIYSILISSDVKSADGKRLPKTIEKRFSVQ